MSEEEKKAVEKFKNLYIKDFNGEPITTDDRLSYIECALITNLIEKLEQEINTLKEIKKAHKEENGKLRVEFEKVYEDNLTLAHELEQEKEKNIFLEGFKVGAEEAIKELKEKNKELEKQLKLKNGDIDYISNKINNHFIDDVTLKNNYISKDKIRKKLEHQNMLWNTPNRQKEYNQEFAEFLEELLEEK